MCCLCGNLDIVSLKKREGEECVLKFSYETANISILANHLALDWAKV